MPRLQCGLLLVLERVLESIFEGVILEHVLERVLLERVLFDGLVVNLLFHHDLGARVEPTHVPAHPAAATRENATAAYECTDAAEDREQLALAAFLLGLGGGGGIRRVADG